MQNRIAGLKVSHRLLLLLPVLIAVVGLFIGLDLQRTKRDLMEGRERALRNVIESAITVVGSFYDKEQSKKLTREQAQEQAKDALRALTYDTGDGRIYAHEFGGVTIVNTVREAEGKNRLDVPNVRDQIATAKAGGGFTTYRQPLGPRIGDLRLGFTSAFKPWEWAIGSAVYIEDVNTIFWQVAAVQIGIAALALVIACAAVLLIARSISRPMAQITVSMGGLADGNLEVAVPFMGQKNEFGRLGAALQVFKDNALAVRDLRTEQEATRAAAELERSRVEAERAQEAAEDQVAIGALGQGLEALAGGNLIYQIVADLAPKTQQLKDNFNKTASRLRDTMTDIAGAIDVMTNGTQEISKASDDLSRRTEQQAASLEETAAALDEITATVRKTAEGAVHVQGVVFSARDDAQHSNEVVRDAVSAMGEIEKSSHQVSQIIGVINEIAFQTNLLALNAGVEAARAGDAGRGFAVVASEVRALAQRSAEAAKEIKTLIAVSSKHVGHGVKLVDETGKSLQRIVGHVGEVHAAITNIAASAKEQATGLHEVNNAVNQMDQVTQQNAAMVEQSTAASHSMAQETEALKRLTGYFQIEVRQSAAATPSITRPPRASQPVATRPAARGGGRAALAVVQAGANEWEEF